MGGLLLVGVAVDPVHAGAGRSPGAVDLPVQRDPLGYPLVFASSVKGALKSLCARRHCMDKSKGEFRVNDRGFLDCSLRDGGGEGGDKDKSDCLICCCLFGGEPRQDEDKARTSKLSVLDLVPLAYPVASADRGYLYLTAAPLLGRASLILEALKARGVAAAGKLLGLVDGLLGKAEKLGSGEVLVLEGSRLSEGDSLDIAGSIVEVNAVYKPGDDGALDVLKGLGGPARGLRERLVVASAEDGAALVERALLRVARVALRRDRKTVARGALWTEEYLPAGTLFLGGAVLLDVANDYCRSLGVSDDKLIDKLLKALEPVEERDNLGVFYVTIGGKETVGRGLIKFHALKG